MTGVQTCALPIYTDIIGLARATGMSMEELAQFLTQLKRGGAPLITPNTKEDTDYVHEEE